MTVGERALGRAIGKVVLVLAGVALGLVAAEWMARSSPLAVRLGWNLSPGVEERVRAIRPRTAGTTRLVGFGDSFAAFRETAGGNFYRIAERRARAAGVHLEVVNLGEAGTGVRRYRENLAAYGERLAPDVAVFAIYLGNDLVDYEVEGARRDGQEARPSGGTASRPQPVAASGGWRAYVKRHSLVLDAGFRMMKRFIPPLRSGTFERNVAVLAAAYAIDGQVIDARLRAIDESTLTRARSDAINPWDAAFGVVRPGLYTDMLSLRGSSRFPRVLEYMLSDFDAIIAYCRARGIHPVFVTIPPSIQVDRRYHAYYQHLGYDVGPDMVGPSVLDDALGRYFRARGVDHLDLLSPLQQSGARVFLPEDQHFNARGQAIAGRALLAFLRKRGLISTARLADDASRQTAAASLLASELRP